MLEACVDSVTSAINAYKGGAERLELCSALTAGGLTPSSGLLKVVKKHVQIPVFVLIRPRGGDFLYTPEEVEVMEMDIVSAKENGADGIVLGALTVNTEVDKNICSRLIDAANPLPVTFHRAFDQCSNPHAALESIISLGCKRLLTSGQADNAENGSHAIRELILLANERISIMPGAGITERNLEHVLKTTGAKEFHSSARSTVSSKITLKKEVKMGSDDDGYTWKQCDVEMVKKLVAISKEILKSS